MRATLNFKRHIPGLLATGGKTDTHEKLDWIISEGGLSRAISFLGPTLESEDEEVQLEGAKTLIELMEFGYFDYEYMHWSNS